MRTLFSLLTTVLLVLLPFVAAQGDVFESFKHVPPCALTCIQKTLPASPCDPTDQHCLCTNQEFQASLTKCVLKACTIKQGLFTKNVTLTACGAPIRDRSHMYSVISVVLATISGICVLLRIGYKTFFTVAEWGLDDLFIVTTFVVGLPSTVLNVVSAAANGLGRDVWTLPPEMLTKFVKTFYILEITYFNEVALLKLSFLFFFLRIFPGKQIRVLIWATIVFDILYGIVFVLAAIFQCTPIKYYWMNWDGEHEGKCININALGWANAAISIALDIWMLAIPLSQLVYLKLAWKKKLGVAMMFGTGIFLTVVSILRLRSLINFVAADQTNPTWDNFMVSLWSTIEINVGIMCACMPTIRVILVRLFPRVLGTSKNPSSHYPSGNKYGNVSKTQGPSRSRLRPSIYGGSGKKGDMGGILVSKDIEVEHGSNDEIHLVQVAAMQRPDPTRSNTRGRNSSELSF